MDDWMVQHQFIRSTEANMGQENKEIDYGNFPYGKESNGAWYITSGRTRHYFETENDAKVVIW